MLSTINPTLPGLGSNVGLYSGRQANNCLRNYMAYKDLLYMYPLNCHKTYSSSNSYSLSFKFTQQYGLIMVVPEILDFIHCFRLEKTCVSEAGEGENLLSLACQKDLHSIAGPCSIHGFFSLTWGDNQYAKFRS